MKQKFDSFEVNSRIMQIMREKNLNKNSLAKLLNLSQPALAKIEKNLNLPSYKLLFEIIQNFPDINTEWLLTGTGKMLRSLDVTLEPEDQKTLVDLVSSQKNEIQFLKDKLEEKDKIISDLSRTNLLLVEKELKNDSAPYPGNKEKMNNAG